MGFPQSESSNQSSNTEPMVDNRVYANSCLTDSNRNNSNQTTDNLTTNNETQRSSGNLVFVYLLLNN